MQTVRCGLQSEEVKETNEEVCVRSREQQVRQLFLCPALFVKQVDTSLLFAKVFHSAKRRFKSACELRRTAHRCPIVPKNLLQLVLL